MARITISGETLFRVGASTFCIGQTTAGYTLYYSADGDNFTAWGEATSASTDIVVTNAAIGMYFYLDGNEDADVVVTW